MEYKRFFSLFLTISMLLSAAPMAAMKTSATKKPSLFKNWWSKRNNTQKASLGLGGLLTGGLGLYAGRKFVSKAVPTVLKAGSSAIKLATAVGGLFLMYAALKEAFSPKDKDTSWREEMKMDAMKVAGFFITIFHPKEGLIAKKLGFGNKA